MDVDLIVWDDEEDPRGNVQHIEASGLTPEEVEDVLRDPRGADGVSRAHPHRPIRFGWAGSGKFVAVVYEVVVADPLVVYPVTAYEVPER